MENSRDRGHHGTLPFVQFSHKGSHSDLGNDVAKLSTPILQM